MHRCFVSIHFRYATILLGDLSWEISMTKASQILLTALFAAIIGIAHLAPARATPIPAGSVSSMGEASKVTTDIRFGRRGYYRPARAFYRPYRVYRPYYRPMRVYRAPVYYRRCVVRPRIVWTPYGYIRRWVRVCR
jgi:hypothetical protein